MDKFVVNGGNKLFGEVEILGAKNAYLPILAACVLVDGNIILNNYPDYTDLDCMCQILENLNIKTDVLDKKILIDATNANNWEVPTALACMVRSSIFTLGAILGRFKKAKIAYPGGCEIGSRPIDIHIAGLRELGVKIVEKHGYIFCDGENMKSGKITLDFPSVGATETLMMASVLIKGETKLFNCAKEPEIVDLQNFLNTMGANIKGAGSDTIVINGVEKLFGGVYTPVTDRILAGTLICGCCMCGGEILLKNVNPEFLNAVLVKLHNSACQIKTECDSILVRGSVRPKSLTKIETAVFPGVPTDLQSPLMALQAVSEGSCMIVENVFESRFKHVPELVKMGADIKIKDRVALVKGVEKLFGAEVFGADLRGTASLVLAGLCAEGYTTINNIFHLDRGYCKLEETLCKLGANIKRV